MSTRPLNSIVKGLIAVPTAQGNRVLAVEWETHDGPHGDDLLIDVSDFLDCPVSGCRWTFDPTESCPDHGESLS